MLAIILLVTQVFNMYPYLCLLQIMLQLLNDIVLCLKHPYHAHLQIFHFHLHLLLVKCSLNLGARFP